MCVTAMCVAAMPNAACFNVIPRPQSVTPLDGKAYNLTGKTTIYCDNELAPEAGMLHDFIKQETGMDLKVKVGKKGNGIFLAVNKAIDNPEGYRLKVGSKGITICGASPAGVFYGIQTLRKALPQGIAKSIEVPAVDIHDSPRFAYRGAHIDVSRHFFNVNEVKTYIDMLALHNINRMHMHLSDDQGWRIEIKSRPRLTEVGAWRNQTVIKFDSGYDGKPHGGFFTQEQAREIVAYAAARHITVIPEIDLPGHMLAALAAYPELGCTGGPYEVWEHWGISCDVLCAGNPEVLKFIKDVLGEIADIFPSKYIHIGGDECPKDEWEECPKCQAKMDELGFIETEDRPREEQMQAYIMQQAEAFLASKGRKVIGWDEILEGGLGPDVTIHSWRGMEGAIEAIKQGHDAILSPTSHFYFDYYQSKDTDNEPFAIGGYIPVKKVYSFNPMPEGVTPEQAKHIIGVQANVWSEFIPTFSHLQYMALPRMAALAEVQWCQQEARNYSEFLERLPQLAALYRTNGYNYAKHVVK